MSTLQRNDLHRLRKYSSRLNRMIDDGSFDRLPAGRRRGLVHRLRKLHDRLLDVVPAAALRHIMAAAAVLVLGISACTGSSTRIGGDSRTDGTVDPWTDTSWDPVVDSGWDPGMDPGWDPGTDPGWDPGTDPGFDPHYDPATPNFFSEGRLNPFGIDASGHLCGWELIPALANLDGDGDLDLFGGAMWYEYTTCIQYFQNTGSPSAPAFASPTVNPFGISGRGTSGGPGFVDIDGDGDLDMFIGGSYGYYGGDTGLNYFENTGTPGSAAFAAPVENPFGISSIRGMVTKPAFVDIDGDGDFDLFTNSYSYWEEAGLQFHENTGSASSPRFAAPVREPFGLRIWGWQLTPEFADLDRDGDQDLFVGGNTYDSGGIAYFQNIGTSRTPAFAPPAANPFGLDVPFYMAFPEFADIDSDGDQDLFVGISYGIVLFYENTEY
ncbi:MAG: VCBS repeat-containing protein [Deltaproteobacteria bacterium]|nr:VCBS repeat-containing protein [Deltaproteobacteria bacterium]